MTSDKVSHRAEWKPGSIAALLAAVSVYAIYGAITGIRHGTMLTGFSISATWGAFGQLLGSTWLAIVFLLGIGLQHRYRNYRFKGVSLRTATVWIVGSLLVAMFFRALVYDAPKIDAQLREMNNTIEARNQQAEMLHVLADRIEKLSLRDDVRPEQLAAISHVMVENLPPRPDRGSIFNR